MHNHAEGFEQAPKSAFEIAGEGYLGYEHVLDTLRAEDGGELLRAEVARVVKEYSLFEIPFLNESDEEMFAVLDLYDPGTARHCYETYQIAKERMEEEIFPGISFATILKEQEHVTLDEFYRACLFHDIGKIAVPRSIINNTMRGVRDLPVSEFMSNDDLLEVNRYGFRSNQTMYDIIQKHEPEGGVTLRKTGHLKEAVIAEAHHNYGGKPYFEFTLPISIGTLHIHVDLSEVLHIADEKQALLSPDRSYKGMFSMAKFMRVVVEDTLAGKIHPIAAYFWLTSELRRYKESRVKDGVSEESAEERADLTVVDTFLAKENKDFAAAEA